MRGPVVVHGRQMYVDDLDTLQILKNRVWGPVETDIIAQHVRLGDTFLDIGAHVGYFSLLASSLVGPEGKVYSFEPCTANHKVLLKNLSINGSKNAMVEQAVVLDHDGVCKLRLSKVNTGDHQAYDDPREPNRQSEEVKAVSLDSYFGPDGIKVDFVKMDVQAAEVYALRGMRRLLGMNPFVKVLLEFWPYGLVGAGSTKAEFLAELKSLGFSLYDVNEESGSVSPVTDAYILSYPVSFAKYTNILCIRPRR